MVMELGMLLSRDGSEDGSWEIKSGTGGLANLRSEGKWWWSGDP
jgi:hypothetical protein